MATFASRLHAVIDRVSFQTLEVEEIDRLVESLDRIGAARRNR